MLLNVHSYYSLRYGTLSIEELITQLMDNGYHTAVLTDINNSSGVFDFIKEAKAKGFNGLVGMEYRACNKLLYIGIAKNDRGLQELNEHISYCNLNRVLPPEQAPVFDHCYTIYPYGTIEPHQLRENEYIGVKAKQLNKITFEPKSHYHKYVIWQAVTFKDRAGHRLHGQLRAVDNNVLLSQLKAGQYALGEEQLIPYHQLLANYAQFPQLIENTVALLKECSFQFDFNVNRNKQTFTGTRYDDKELLSILATDGLKQRYGANNKRARERVEKELEIIDKLGFSSYFLITHDIVRYGMSRGFYHVGRGSGANSVVAYCLRITDVCPIELDLYFERFLNPKRKSPPDFDIDFGWDERDEMYSYIFNRYGTKNTALLGAMSTFKEKSVIRELGKVYGLPKGDIDRIFDDPNSVLNKNEIINFIISVTKELQNFPNLRTIHASGVLISEHPITCYSGLDLPPKGLPTVQWDMYVAEDIGFEKFDILSQRGISHIKECAQIVKQNKGLKIDVHEVEKFKQDDKIKQQLKSADTIGCFYIESPAMRGLLKKLHCDDYLTLVAASSIIRPGVAKSGMMRAYIERYHDPSKVEYLHPIMREQLQETYGVMVYQEDVLKIGHHFGGLDLADADVLRRMMSGKHRSAKHLKEIEQKYFEHCKDKGYSEYTAREIWRQIESFAGYSFSKAHSASFAVESFQSLFLKTYYPLEFYVAVINNFGGFYQTRIYVHSARKAGANILLPCINNSDLKTTIYGKDVYLGFIHIKSLEANTVRTLLEERQNGQYTDLYNFISRIGIGLEQLILLIRIDAFRFTGKNKKDLLWDAHLLFNKEDKNKAVAKLFDNSPKTYTLPALHTDKLEDVYDEIELLGFPVTMPLFGLLEDEIDTKVTTKELLKHLGKIVSIIGDFVTYKHVRTVKGDNMAFGTFLDVNGDFFDTTHFPPCFKAYPFKGMGIYKITGKVVEEFDFPSIEVDRMEKLAVRPDPRSV